MLQDLSCFTLWVQVQDKSRPRHGQTPKPVYMFCTAAQSPPSPITCPPNRIPTPTTKKTVKLSLFRMIKQPMLQWHHLPGHYSLALAWYHSLLMAPLLRVPRAGLLAPVLAQVPTSAAASPLHLDVQGQDPLLQRLARLQVLPDP